MKLGVAQTKAPRVTLVKRDLQAALPGALAREPDQIARAVEPGNAGKAAPGEFERMTALAAAQVEDAVVALDPGAADQQVDLLRGVAVVLDHIAIGFEIERVEQRAPPIGWQVAFEVGDRAQGTRADSPALLDTFATAIGGSSIAGAGANGPHAAGLSAHPRHPPVRRGHQKRRLPDPGNRRRAAFSPTAATPDRNRPTARAGRGDTAMRPWELVRGSGARSLNIGFRRGQQCMSAGSSEYSAELSSAIWQGGKNAIMRPPDSPKSAARDRRFAGRLRG